MDTPSRHKKISVVCECSPTHAGSLPRFGCETRRTPAPATHECQISHSLEVSDWREHDERGSSCHLPVHEMNRLKHRTESVRRKSLLLKIFESISPQAGRENSRSKHPLFLRITGGPAGCCNSTDQSVSDANPPREVSTVGHITTHRNRLLSPCRLCAWPTHCANRLPPLAPPRLRSDRPC